jgi:hypothetical protein
MARTIDKLSVTLGRILKSRGMEARLHEYRILGLWGRTVGPAIARHARPQTLRGSKLVLTVDSPAWMQQLSLMKPEIIEKLNRALGRATVKDLTLKLGEFGPPGREAAEEKPVRAELSSEDREKIGHYVRGISDTDTREALRRLFERELMNRTKKTR